MSKAEKEVVETKKNDKSELLIGVIASAIIVLIVGAIVYFSMTSKPNIVYEPKNACSVITRDEAAELLGEKTVNSTTNEPTVSKNTATSRCGYTDGNTDTANLIVAAVIIRSGINDTGATQNKSEFATSKTNVGVEAVEGVGDEAFYNAELGQLNVLKDKDWYIFSYGPGSQPGLNEQEDVVAFAEKAFN